MRRIWIALIFLVMSLTAQAGSTLRVGSEVLVTGDSATRAIELLGQPIHIEPVENKFGAYRGELWQYRRDGRVITVTVAGGKIVNIDDRQS